MLMKEVNEHGEWKCNIARMILPLEIDYEL